MNRFGVTSSFIRPDQTPPARPPMRPRGPAVEVGDGTQTAGLTAETSDGEEPVIEDQATAPATLTTLTPTQLAHGLMYHAEAGDVEAVKVWIAAGADVNEFGGNGWTPVMFAAFNGRTEVIEVLAVAGADLEAREAQYWGNGKLPIHLAVCRGHLGALKALIAAGADVNGRTRNFWSALEMANHYGYKHIVRELTGVEPDEEGGRWRRA